MNYYAKYVFILLLLFVLGSIFESYKRSEAKREKIDQYELIKKYLLNDSTLARSDKPIMWVHVTFDTNARRCLHFIQEIRNVLINHINI